MKILTVGDSFTYGEELSDRDNAWPNLLQKKMQCTITNLGSPGTGNASLIRNVVNNLNTHDLFIIAWTHHARSECADELGTYDIWPGCTKRMFVDKLSYRHQIIAYNTQYYNDEYLYKQYLLGVILLQNYLTNNNKKYIMLDAFSNADEKLRFSEANAHLIKQIDSTYYLGWPNETMMNWTYNTPIGSGGHFLEEGHIKVADKIYEHIRLLNWA